jgi:hypothetical protein
MTMPSAEVAVAAHPEHWFKAAAATGAAGVAVATIAATLHGSGSAASYWESPALYVAYALAGLAVTSFFCGVAGWRFPMAEGVKSRRHERIGSSAWDCQDAQIVTAPDHGQFAPSNAARPVSQLREAIDLASGRGDVGEALSLFDIGEPSKLVKHSWCVKCGFPFIRPQNKAVCAVDRPGENSCAKRARTPVPERRRQMAINPNTLYRVHTEWLGHQQPGER